MSDSQKYALKILDRAQELIEQGWCQNWYAVDAAGERVTVVNPSACAFCATGAVSRAFIDTFNETWEESLKEPWKVSALDIANYKLGEYCSQSVPSFNDLPGRTKEEVLELFTEAKTSLQRTINE